MTGWMETQSRRPPRRKRPIHPSPRLADSLRAVWTSRGAGRCLYTADLRILRDNPYAPVLQRAFELGGIEFGRIDFGLVGDPGGGGGMGGMDF